MVWGEAGRRKGKKGRRGGKGKGKGCWKRKRGKQSERRYMQEREREREGEGRILNNEVCSTQKNLSQNHR